jgi:hypothetical protein
MITFLDFNKNGDTVPSMTSKVTPIQRKRLDSRTPIFHIPADKGLSSQRFHQLSSTS